MLTYDEWNEVTKAKMEVYGYLEAMIEAETKEAFLEAHTRLQQKIAKIVSPIYIKLSPKEGGSDDQD